jgi:starch synthase
MHVVHVASEVAPYAKTGGLGDVLAALPSALARTGADVTVILPGHRSAFARAGATSRLGAVRAPVGTRTEEAAVISIDDAPVPTVLLDLPRYFDRAALYGEDGRDYDDNAERFVAFCRTALAWLRTWERAPDVIHVHDWQAALVPAFLGADRDLHPSLRGSRSVATIHNLAFQGRFAAGVWPLLNLDRGLFTPQGLEFYGDVDFLKAGLVFADALTTVSPHYAEEIRTPEFGDGLDGVLRQRAADLRGILNGVDYAVWSPDVDPTIAARYDRRDRSGKARCKAALQRRLGLAVTPDAPLLGMISRLASQKGIDLVADAAPALLDATDVQLAILGSGESELEAQLRALQDRAPTRVAVAIGFDDDLAHGIEAGSDAFLMPSRYEPCGLSQLYSLRYGTVPIVHATGGLVDTVADYDPRTDQGTGFVFGPCGRNAQREHMGRALLEAIQRALVVRRDAARWAGIVDRGMAADFSWDRSAAQYRALYDELRGRAPRTL